MASNSRQSRSARKSDSTPDTHDQPLDRNGSRARDLKQHESDSTSQSLDSGDGSVAPFNFTESLSQMRPGQPNVERLHASDALLASSETWSPEDAGLIVQATSDLLSLEADFELKTAGLKLLRSVAIHPELAHLHPELLDVALQRGLETHICDQIAVIYHILTRTEARRSSEVPLDPATATRIAQYIIEHMQSMFDSAEKARSEQYAARKLLADTGDTSLNNRPDEEITFIRALKILQTLIQYEDSLATYVDQLIRKATQLLKHTTGQAIMTALLELLQLTFFHASEAPIDFKACIYLVCHLGNSASFRAQSVAYQTLCQALLSPLGPQVMRLLVDDILAADSHVQSLKLVALRALAEAYFCGESVHCRRDSFPTEVASLSDRVNSNVLAKKSTPFAQPLLDICLATYPHIYDDDFNTLVETTQTLADLEWTPKSGNSTNVQLGFAQGLIRLFICCFRRHGRAAARIYAMLISIVAIAESAPVKLAIIKFLARLRCDQSKGVQVVEFPDTHHLAESLYRTMATASNARDSVSPASKLSNTSHSSLSKRDGSHKSLNLVRTRSRSRSSPQKFRDSFRVASQPLWIYEDGRQGLPVTTSERPSEALFVREHKVCGPQQGVIDPELWLQFMIDVLRNGNDWEIYSYVLVHLPSQLSNCTLFQPCVRQISVLHDLLTEHLSESLFPDPPASSNIRKGDIALCLYSALAVLLGYQESIGVRQWNRVVSTFRLGIEKWDRTGKLCIHALSICCHELPHIISNHLNIIVEMMQKRITHPEIAADILEFLGGLSRLPEAWDRSDFLLHQKIFSICIRYLQHAREQRAGFSSVPNSPSPVSNRASHGVTAGQPGQPTSGDLAHRKLHEYVFTTAYQVMIFWFLALDVSERHRHVAWITQELSFKTDSGKEEMEPQSLVFLDMMHRTAFSDLGETRADSQFADTNQGIHRRTWLMGLSVITAEFLVNDATGRISHGQFTKRQASGTTHAIYYHNTEEMPIHQNHENVPSSGIKLDPFSMYPNHMILQLVSTISPLPAPLQPIPLPENDEFTNRLIRVFDATDTVDGHKAAVIYLAEGQKIELDILANDQGSEAFDSFLSKLAYEVPLRDAKFNTQGLDRMGDTDGSYTYAWRDRVTEIVFHVPTIMPNDLSNDPAFLRKKSHIGNDHVKILFNESGLPYDPKTFASDFNSINIVITPEAHCHAQSTSKEGIVHEDSTFDAENVTTDPEVYYIIETLTSGEFPAISPTASPKIISTSGLPTLIRQLAFNASVLCQVWPQNIGEYTSCWLFRLQQIMKLREKHAAANVSSNVGYPQAADAGPSFHFDGQVWTGTVSHGGLAEREKLVSSLDFTRWTK